MIETVRHHADPNATVHNLTIDVTHTYYIGHNTSNVVHGWLPRSVHERLSTRFA